MADLTPCPDSRIVETSHGKIQGRRLIYQGEKQVDAFQGIPFAKPPIGKLRFQKPEAPERWDGVRETKKFGPCSIVAPEFHNFTSGVPLSEDCLYLNVFSPCWKAPEGGFAVIVFIHGGAFEEGNAINFGDIGICENIVTRDVIFVTINYRLGYLGFMTTGDSVCPGNNGLWDQIAALRWVNDNIEAFGGNKNNITLLGQSSGGVSVEMLHLSPHSTNLFHKMIPMAGSALCRYAINKNMAQQCRKKASRLGISEHTSSEELLDKLRSFPADKFAVDLHNPEKEADADFETVPLLDGDFFPEPFDDLRKKAAPKPLLTGVTKEEGIFFLPGKKPTVEDLNEVITFAIRDAKEKDIIADKLKTLYFKDGIPACKEIFMRKITHIASDHWINAPVLEMCRKTVAVQDQPVYLYVFEHFNPKVMGSRAKNLPIQDVTHLAESIYLFKRGGILDTSTMTDDDKHVMDIFTTAFTNFAKYGNPNGDRDGKSDLCVRWEPIDKQNHSRNFVFTSGQPHMSEHFFEGRTAEFAKIINNQHA